VHLLGDYDYDLPQALIAQVPAQRRDRSRLLCLGRRTGHLQHFTFQDLPGLLSPSDLLVVNNTEVIPGRLVGAKESGGRVEALILDYADARPGPDGKSTVLRCLVKASKRPKAGTTLTFDEGLTARVVACEGGVCTLVFPCNGDFEEVLQRVGRVPLPPYIRRDDSGPGPDDRQAYQTVYACCKGAIAAPTAGLHFTRELMDALGARGVDIVEITLHVGYGTFLPVRVSDIREHRMHAERFRISAEGADQINRAREAGRRIVAVGTTSVRTLEYAGDERGVVRAGEGACDLYIYPGYRFKVVDAMITNFHLPKSTLLMLVSAFAGIDNVRRAYEAAVAEKYRFFSYGDAMLIA
jgi:S-adenosylmethionine:tRNA ribosyltransferase-isomerase